MTFLKELIKILYPTIVVILLLAIVVGLFKKSKKRIYHKKTKILTDKVISDHGLYRVAESG